MRPIALLAAALPFVTGTALACGASAGGSASGAACSLSEHSSSASDAGMRVGGAYFYTTTSLRFGDGLSPDERRQGVLATLDRRVSPRTTLQLGLGALVGGELRQDGVSYKAGAGPVLAFAFVWRAIGEAARDPFLLVTTQATGSTATTEGGGERERLSAIDVRAGVVAGIPVAEVLRPFAVARVFGGPIWWRLHNQSRIGTDAYHYQLGLGASVSPGARINLFFESVLLGERGFSAGAGVAF